MIIVLGEAIAQIVTAIAGAQATPWSLLTGLAAFTVVAMLWWLYFDFGSVVAETTINARRAESFRLIRSIFLVGHFLAVVSLLAFAAGLGGLVMAAAEGRPAAGSLRLCTVALAVYLVNNALIGWLAIRQPSRRVLTWLLPNLTLLVTLTALADRLLPLVPLLLITAFLAIETLPTRRRRAVAQD